MENNTISTLEDINSALEDVVTNIKPIVGGKSLDIAVQILQKEIPQKPISASNLYSCDIKFCPNCNDLITDYSSPNRCVRCGQVLDWNDNEEE